MNWTLRSVFVLSAVVQVLLACVIVWCIGFASQMATVADLSTQLRNQTMGHIIDQTSNQLSIPVLAVNEVEFATQNRLLNTGRAAPTFFDYSQDVAYYTSMSNIIRHYPGVTATAMQTSSGVLMTAFLAFDESDNNKPPPLAYLNQDNQTNWEWKFWLLTEYNQTLTPDELFSQSSLFSANSDWFDTLDPAWLAQGRQHPLISLGYVDPTMNSWYTACLGAANMDIQQDYRLAWSIPKQGVNRRTTSVQETFSVCKAHVNYSPKIEEQWSYVNASFAAGSPRAQLLYNNTLRQQARIDAGRTPSPILMYVADVTFSPLTLTNFLLTRLNNFIVENGAAFVLSSSGWVIASTLPGPELNVLVYLPDLFNNSDPVAVEYRANLTDKYSEAMNFVGDLNDHIQSPSWLEQVGGVPGQNTKPDDTVFTWEESNSLNGEDYYLQFAVLAVPASDFRFVLAVYSRKSDYQGSLMTNLKLSGGLAAVVVVISVLVTLFMTQCVHRPIMNLMLAMKSVIQSPQQQLKEIERQKKSEKSEQPKLSASPKPTRSTHEALELGLLGHQFDGRTSSASTLGTVLVSNKSVSGESPQPSPTSPIVPYQLPLVAASPAVRSQSVNSRNSRSSKSDNYEEVSSLELEELLKQWTAQMTAQGFEVPDAWNDSLPVVNTKSDMTVRSKPLPNSPSVLARSGAAGGDDEKKEIELIELDTPQKRSLSFNHHQLNGTNHRDTNGHQPLSHGDTDASPGNQSLTVTTSKFSKLSRALSKKRNPLQMFNCMSRLHEIVALQMTFGSMLLRLKNSAYKLEQANASKRTFLRFVFHEVRVPLNACSLAIEQLNDELSELSETPLSCLQLLSIVQDQLATVTRILNDVLSFQRIEDGELLLDIQPFAVKSMVENTVHSFRAEFKRKALQVQVRFELVEPATAQQVDDPESLRIDIADDSYVQFQSPKPYHALVVNTQLLASDAEWFVCADQYRLRQVLSNFISNAVKFDPEGGEIDVLVRLIKSNGDVNASTGSSDNVYSLSISVTDTGTGISESGLKSLFQMYRQIQAGQMQQGGGSGLGLFICKKLIQLHGGEVKVESRLGSGSTFTFRVPVMRVPQLESKHDNVKIIEPKVNSDEDSPVVANVDDTTGVQLSMSPHIPSTTVTAVTLSTAPTDSGERATNGQSSPHSESNSHPLEGEPVLQFAHTAPPAPLRRISNQKPGMTSHSAVDVHAGCDVPLRVLVVEDSAVNRKLMCSLLTRLGLIVESAEDGWIAFQMIENYVQQQRSLIPSLPATGLSCQYDLILLDNEMPQMTGVECVAAIRALGVGTLASGITGNALQEDIQRFKEAGATEVLTKPVTKLQIEALVERARVLRAIPIEARGT